MFARMKLIGAAFLLLSLATPAQDERPLDAKMVAELVKQLGSKDVEEQREAAVMLSRVGSGVLTALPALIKALDVPDDAVRFYCMRALGNCGPKAKDAIPAVVKVLQEDNPLLVRPAAATLGKFGKEAVGPVTKLLADPNPRTRRMAAVSLALVGPDAAPAAPALAQRLRDVSFRVRRIAAEALTVVRPTTAEVREALVQTITTDQDPDVCRVAAIALGKMGDDSLPSLLRLLESKNADHRYHGAVGVSELGPKAAPAVKGLAKLLGEKDEELRTVGSAALGKIGEPALERLIECLGDESADVRRGAAVALGSMGTMAKKAVKRLIAGLGDKDTAAAAAAALGRIGDAAAVTPLGKLLEGDDPEAARAAATALGELGPVSATLIGPLVVMMRGTDKGSREAAAVALIRIGKPAIAPVKKVLEEKEARLRVLALLVLGSIGGPDAVPEIAARLKDGDLEVKLYAARMLGRIGPEAKAGLKALEEALASAEEAELVEVIKQALIKVGDK
jgi:HEAT repeat protein